MKRFGSIVAISLALSVLPVHAQPVPGYTMPSTQMWDMKSDGGDIYRILVSYPAVEAPADGFPLDPPPTQWRHLAKYKSGGRDAFLDLMTGKLRTEIGKRFKIDPNRQSLFGHSLGGLLGLHALYARPQAFHSIVAATPSMEWNEQGVLNEEREFTARLTSGQVARISRLLVVAGGRDIDDDPYVEAQFAKRMQQLPGYGLRSRFLRYADEGT